MRELGAARARPAPEVSAAIAAALPPPPPAAQPIPVHNAAVSAAMLGAMRAIALILATRLLLLLSLGGAFWLGCVAMNKESYMALGILIAYASLTVLPLTALAWPTKPQSGG